MATICLPVWNSLHIQHLNKNPNNLHKETNQRDIFFNDRLKPSILKLIDQFNHISQSLPAMY